jgi:hypothetical protein
MIKPNIWNFSANSLLSWTASYSVWEPISYIILPMIFKAKTTQEYYNPQKFSFATVVAGDYLYSTMIFLVAQQVITNVFGSSPSPSISDWSKHLLTFLGIQWISDFSFYNIVKSLPDKYTPRYLDFFKRYSADVGAGALLGDSAYGIVWVTLTQYMATYVPTWMQLFLITTFLFLTLILTY